MAPNIFACIFGCLALAVVVQSSDSCLQEAATKMQSCAATFQQVLTDSASSGADQGNIMGAICSTEGKAAITCIITNLQGCPELAQQQGMAGMLTGMPFNYTDLMNQGGIEVACDMMTGGPCSKLQQCVPSPGDPQEEPHANMVVMEASMNKYVSSTGGNGVAMPYLFFQKIIGITCGHLKPMIVCFMNVLKECSSIDMETINKQFANVMKGVQPGLKGMPLSTFEEQQDFVETGCPNVPKDFDTNICVQKQLMSPEFAGCHNNFSQAYPSKADKANCKAFEQLRDCFMDTVAPECGKPAAAFLTSYSPMVVDGLSDNCETSSATITTVSTMTMMGVAMILGMLL